MAQKTNQKRETIAGHYRARVCSLLCNRDFRKGLNLLRTNYLDWVLGPSMTHTRDYVTSEDEQWEETFDIDRSQVNSPGSVDEREEPFIFAWESFEIKWSVN